MDVDNETIGIPQEIDHRSLPRTPQAPRRDDYSQEEKALALAVYAETGSLQTASEHSKIPRSTVRYWIENDPEIDAKLDALRQAIRSKAAHLHAEVSVLAVEALRDRVVNGDYRIDKEGNVTRLPIPGRELAWIASITADKHALLTANVVKQRGEDSSLTKLAEGLIQAIDRRTMRAKADAAVPQGSEPDSAD